jgi:uncharacterized repeat protein (TIGR03803 family)
MHTIQRGWLAAGLLLICGSAFADAGLSTLYQFKPLLPLGTKVNADGAGVTALIQDSAGNLYGVTMEGGSSGSGTVFQLTPDGSLTTLYAFSPLDTETLPKNADGAGPNSLVRDASGNLYGTAAIGGSNGNGTVFEISSDGVFSVLHEFDALGPNADGAQPVTLTLGTDANLYGVAAWGGTGNAGTVFRISPAGDFTVLYAFAEMSPGVNVNADGGLPASILQAADGTLYGSTTEGGPNGTGTVFRMTTSGDLTTLYTFGPCAKCFFLGTNLDGPISYANADGALANAVMLASDGNLYGTTSLGGSSGNGTVFRVSPTGAFTSLHQFAGGSDGANPEVAPIEASDGVLLGTSGSVIYRLDASAGTTVPLYLSAGIEFGAIVESTANSAQKFYVAGGTAGASPSSSIFVLTNTVAPVPIAQTVKPSGGGGGALAGSGLLALALCAALRLTRRSRTPS